MWRIAQTKQLAAIVAVLVFAITQSVIIEDRQAGASFAERTDQNHRQWHIDRVINHFPASDAMPVIGLQGGSVGVGESLSVPVVLSRAPAGLAGYYVEVSVSDTGVAQIAGVEFPDFGLTRDWAATDSGMRISAADLFGVIESGAEDSTLAVVSIVGLAEGTASVSLRVFQMDDDEGGPIEAVVSSGTVSVS